MARRLYGLDGAARRLPAERDQNFHLTSEDGEEFVLKIFQAEEDSRILDCQDRVLERLAAAGLPFRFPRVRPTLSGGRGGEVAGKDAASHLVRMVEWVPGTPLARARPHTAGLLTELGSMLGSVDRALEGFRHPAAERAFEWDLRRSGEVVDRSLAQVEGEERRELVAGFRALFRERVEPRADRLPCSVIHGDGNDHNVLVAPAGREEKAPAGRKKKAPAGGEEGVPAGGEGAGSLRVTGLVDFGDLVRSWRIGEAAVGAAYALLDREDPLAAAARVVEGYHRVLPITEEEAHVLLPLIGMRLAVSVVQSARRRRTRPEDDYLTISEAPAWAALERLAAVDPDFAAYSFRAACGLPPCPASRGVVAWIEANPDAAGPVLGGEPGEGAPRVLPLGVGSPGVGPAFPPEPGPPPHAVGRHDEVRWVRDPALEEPADPVPEWRSVHLGLDLFAPAGTPVLAPLPGTVEDVRGGALLLRHEPDEGEVVFRTRYAGLAPESLEELEPGRRIERGDAFGAVGSVAHEESGEAPLLHFQLVVDPVGRGAAFPAHVRPSERAVWRSLSPDPNLLLRLPGVGPAGEGNRTAEILEARRRLLGPSLSVHYRRPLHIVRGWRQHLYDAEGQPYLDGVNNVAHVGHEHPRVVEALVRQAAVLNTNSRYLHEGLVRYCERLVATLPEPLRICYLVCTGSEANELALRMARTHTGRRDVVVVEGAYHGNTSSLVEMSPYKYRGPGGDGPPPRVHEVPLPDTYRGRYRAIGSPGGEVASGIGETASGYADHVREAAEEAAARGGPVAAFFVEPLPGCAGQVVPPPGYLAEAFAHVRDAGGVCVADEVQTGFGRSGSHFWAFEAHGVVPDIVTLGKPMGNGHPLAAVVTTPGIAASFATGMEYFNTFGGNPVSVAVGEAVLDVMEEEGLQEHAHRIGRRLRADLRSLMDRHPLVGDVRGMGLYLGVELVLDREARRPAGRHAAYVAERLRDHRILVGTDGPDGNVLKIKPPMVFTAADGVRLVETLGRILGEDLVRVE